MTQSTSLLERAPEAALPASLLPPLEQEGSMSLWEVTRTSFDSLFANKVRSALTMLGVIIGVGSVVALMALGAGASNSITSQIQSIGTNLLFIAPGSFQQGPGAVSSALNLSLNDYDAIVALNLPVNGIAPSFNASASFVAAAADKQATIAGTTPAYAVLQSLTLKSGTLFDDAQARNGANVIVLGSTLAKDLFGSGQAVGQTVRVNGQPLRVIGVLNAKGGAGGGSVDMQALAPLKYVLDYFPNTRTADGNRYRLSSIILSVRDATDVDGVQGRLTALMREQHHLPGDGKKDDFTVLSQAAFLSTLNTITGLLTAFLAAVAGISLLVGGIGIMNIMLVSVTERTREIGLRKAVGAREQDILMQFLVEAIVLSLTGGLIGLALGGGLALAVTVAGVLNATVSPTSVMLAVGFAVAVGLFFGIYPAQRASRLNPIDALRYE